MYIRYVHKVSDLSSFRAGAILICATRELRGGYVRRYKVGKVER